MAGVIFTVIITLFLIASLMLILGVVTVGAIVGAIENYPLLVLGFITFIVAGFFAAERHMSKVWDRHPDRFLRSILNMYYAGECDPYMVMSAFMDAQRKLRLSDVEYENWLFENKMLLDYRQFF